jgi:peptide/nickel transport system permease protein
MIQYLIKRLLIFIPTLLVISLLAFGLSKMAPGDPLEKLPDSGIQNSLDDQERIRRENARLLGLDKPAFYVAFTSKAYPDTLYKILKKTHRQTLSKLVAQYGNWEQIQSYYHQIGKVDYEIEQLDKAGHKEHLRSIRPTLKQLYISHHNDRITSLLDQVETAVANDSLLQAALTNSVKRLRRNYQNVRAKQKRHLLYIPALAWQGWDNQYHNWLVDFVQFDFGISYFDGRPVASRMKDALFWTIILNLAAIFMAYLISIPLGVFSAIWSGSVFDRSTTLLSFILYSLPSFWIATMLVVFFTTPEYGMDWFPSLGTGELPDDAPLWSRISETASHLILPVFCLTYSALAFISRQVRGGMLNVIRQDYIRTAWAKGLDSRKVVWKHAFRNALFPVITMFANILPAVFAGAVVIEVIFNIPGMGKLTVDAIFQRDWPVVYTVLMLSAALTMAGILLADLLYALVDPRVSYRITKR